MLQQKDLTSQGAKRCSYLRKGFIYLKVFLEREKELIEWLNNAGDSLKNKIKEYESFFSDFNTSMRSNEQEVTDTLNAN